MSYKRIADVLLIALLVSVSFIAYGSILADVLHNNITLSDDLNTYLDGVVKIGEKKVFVDVADTKKAREQGFSSRNEPVKNQGILFIFEEDGRHGIWMKDMKFSIDIIWINSSFQIVDMKKNAAPDTYPEIFYPKIDAAYVLEVPAGMIDREKIQINDRVRIFRN